MLTRFSLEAISGKEELGGGGLSIFEIIACVCLIKECARDIVESLTHVGMWHTVAGTCSLV